MTNIEKIRQEIERRLKYTHDWLRGDEKRHPKQTAISKNYYKMKGDERTLDALLAFIDSLPEEKQPEDLDEAAEKYSNKYCSDWAYRLEYEDAFIAGAKWQESQAPLPEDTVLFLKGVEEGKRLMMEDAVEGWIVKDITNNLAVTAKNINLDGFKFGDKVKIIIVKQ